jgi:uncharacterized RDD family membrane protein YckC
LGEGLDSEQRHDAPVVAQYASWRSRAAARLIDLAIIVAVWLGGDLAAGSTGAGAGAVLGFCLYRPLTHAFYGQTVGKRLLRLRLVKPNRTGRGVGLAAGFGREVTMLVLEVIPFVSLANELRPLWNRKKQTWHDTLAGTYVVPARTDRDAEIPPASPGR